MRSETTGFLSGRYAVTAETSTHRIFPGSYGVSSLSRGELPRYRMVACRVVPDAVRKA